MQTTLTVLSVNTMADKDRIVFRQIPQSDVVFIGTPILDLRGALRGNPDLKPGAQIIVDITILDPKDVPAVMPPVGQGPVPTPAPNTPTGITPTIIPPQGPGTTPPPGWLEEQEQKMKDAQMTSSPSGEDVNQTKGATGPDPEQVKQQEREDAGLPAVDPTPIGEPPVAPESTAKLPVTGTTSGGKPASN